MRKIILIVFLLTISTNILISPHPLKSESVQIIEEPVLHEDLINAIFYVEARYDTFAYNPDENAVGGLQIRPIRLNDYNKRTGKDYTLDQMYDFDKAKEIFIYYAEMYDSDEIRAKRWNGSGPMTIIYWDKVKLKL